MENDTRCGGNANAALPDLFEFKVPPPVCESVSPRYRTDENRILAAVRMPIVYSRASLWE